MSGILTYALHYEGEFNKNSLGAVSEAAKLAGEIGAEAHAVVVGDDMTDELAAKLGKYGASKVYYASAPVGIAQPVVDVMAKLIQDNGYSYALFGGGLLGFEIGAGLAARLGGGVTMEVTAVKVQDGKLVAERPILQDSAIVDVDYVGELGVIIGRLNAFEIAENGGSADGQDRRAQALPRGRHLRRDPAQGGHAELREHRRDQQGPERADLRVLRPRRGGRPEQDRPQAHRGHQGEEGRLSPSMSIAPIEYPPQVNSAEEFVGPPVDPEGERIEVGVAIVGGGPAGLACAIRLMQLLENEPQLAESLGEVPVALIEKGKTPGSHR